MKRRASGLKGADSSIMMMGGKWKMSCVWAVNAFSSAGAVRKTLLPPDPKKQIETQDLAWFAYFGRHLFVLIWTGTTKQNISFKCEGRNSHDHDHLVKIPQYGWTAKYRCKASAFGYGSPGDVTTSVRVSCEMVDVISEHLIWCKHKELANLKISEATFIIWASGEIPQ